MGPRVLIDTSIWIDHLGRHDAGLERLLQTRAVLIHPFVVGELACGSLKDRDLILRFLERLPRVIAARHAEVLEMIDRHALQGRGIGWVDAHLLGSVLLTPDARLWTRDKRLSAVATSLGCGHAGGALH